MEKVREDARDAPCIAKPVRTWKTNNACIDRRAIKEEGQVPCGDNRVPCLVLVMAQREGKLRSSRDETAWKSGGETICREGGPVVVKILVNMCRENLVPSCLCPGRSRGRIAIKGDLALLVG